MAMFAMLTIYGFREIYLKEDTNILKDFRHTFLREDEASQKEVIVEKYGKIIKNVGKNFFKSKTVDIYKELYIKKIKQCDDEIISCIESKLNYIDLKAILGDNLKEFQGKTDG